MEIFYEKKNTRYKKIAEEFVGFPDDGVYLVFDGTQNKINKLFDFDELELTPSVEINTSELIYFWSKMSEKQNNLFSNVDLAKWSSVFAYRKVTGNNTFEFDFMLDNPNSFVLPEVVYFKNGYRYKKFSDLYRLTFPLDGLYFVYKSSQFCIVSKESYDNMPSGFINYLCIFYMLSNSLNNFKNVTEKAEYVVKFISENQDLSKFKNARKISF